MADPVETRNRLAREDAGFRRLARKHQEYEQRLDELRHRRYLSTDEQMEEVRLKKMKLALKDQMEVLIQESAG